MINFTTKSGTLKTLRPILKSAEILPQVNFSVGEYYIDNNLPIKLLEDSGMLENTVIVRSSAQNEDTSESSNAGKFLSIGNVTGENSIREAVSKVADAMGGRAKGSSDNIIFIQPYLSNVSMSGVAFTLDPNTGGHYFVINYDDETGSTCSVTDGTGTA